MNAVEKESVNESTNKQTNKHSNRICLSRPACIASNQRLISVIILHSFNVLFQV